MSNDLLLSESGDLIFTGGDLTVAFSDHQVLERLLTSDLGHFKEFPLAGVGIDRYANSSRQEKPLERLIKLQLEADGFSTNGLVVSDLNSGIDLTGIVRIK